MIGRAAERLIRRSWGNIDQLAQELYAIFTSELPLDAPSLTINQPAGATTAPIKVNSPLLNDTPAITITHGPTSTNISNTGGTTTFTNTSGGINTTFGGSGGSTTTIGGTTFGGTNLGGSGGSGGGSGGSGGGGDNGGTGGGGGGGADLGGIEWPGQNPGDTLLAVPNPEDNPFVLHGVVGGKIDGQTYSVTVYAKAPRLSPAIGTLKVRQAQIDPDDTIPPGTQTPVLVFPGEDPDSHKRVILDAVMYVPVYLEDPS